MIVHILHVVVTCSALSRTLTCATLTKRRTGSERIIAIIEVARRCSLKRHTRDSVVECGFCITNALVRFQDKCGSTRETNTAARACCAVSWTVFTIGSRVPELVALANTCVADKTVGRFASL